MTVTTRQHVTDVFAMPVRNAEVAPVEPHDRDAKLQQAWDSGLVMVLPTIRQDLQDLVNKKYEHLCVCSPNRSDMLAADAEMKAHPGYAEYKARRDAAMAAHG